MASNADIAEKDHLWMGTKGGQVGNEVFPSPGKGTYVFILRLTRGKTIRVGRPGMMLFAAGYYAYVGSALGPGGLQARLRHHMAVAERPLWHLDYLRRETVPCEAWIVVQENGREHLWADALYRSGDMGDWVPGFGCSDCKCPTHLFYYKNRPGFHRFKNLTEALFPNDQPVRRLSTASLKAC